MYGSQAHCVTILSMHAFEKDVNMYGSQAAKVVFCKLRGLRRM